MRQFIDYIVETNRVHWGNSVYQWVFFIAVIIIFIFERNRQVRNIFAWLPVIVQACIITPLFLSVLSFFGVGHYTYVARMFSFIPLVYSMGIGVTLATGKTKGYFKLALTAGICLFLALTGVNVYKIEWMKPAENLAKVPGDVLEIRELFEGQDNGVCVAAPESLANYIRQVNPNLITPYARNVGEIGFMLESEAPDVTEIMRLAGMQSVDYVIAPKAAGKRFKRSGYVPYAKTADYSIYAVSGVERLARELNDKRQVSRITHYDAEGEKKATERGYTTICYEYDDNGYVAAEYYLDENDEPYERFGAYSSVHMKNSPRGLLMSMIYRDRNGKPVYISGCAEVRYHYDCFGQTIGESYHDEKGQLTNKEDDVYASKRFETEGNKVTEWYQDLAGRNTLCRAGYARAQYEYEEYQLKAERYYGLEGDLLLEIGEDAPVQTKCMLYPQMTKGAEKDDDRITFATSVPDNQFCRILFQIYDKKTGAFVLEFGSADGVGEYEGSYVNDLPDGLYNIVFKASTTRQDEYLSSLEYLRAGETLNFHYVIDEFEETGAAISGFYIGREGYSQKT